LSTHPNRNIKNKVCSQLPNSMFLYSASSTSLSPKCDKFGKTCFFVCGGVFNIEGAWIEVYINSNKIQVYIICVHAYPNPMTHSVPN